MRLFVSVDVDDLADELRAVQDRFRDADGLRFTDPGQAHVTLKFLGETDESERPALERALADAVDESGVTAFDATLEGLGVFPDLSYISVVWVGVSAGTKALTSLHEAVESRTTALGFDPEEHAFTPHVTIARMDHAAGKERVQAVVQSEEPTVGSTRVEAVCLTESTLTADGPAYSTVRRFELAD